MLQTEAEGISTAIEALGVFPEPSPGEKQNAASMSRYLIRVAAILKEPGEEVGRRGQAFLAAANAADSRLSAMARLVQASGSEEVEGTFYSQLEGGLSDLEQIEEVVPQLEELLASFASAEVMSASVRRSLRPARQGIRSLQDAIGVMSAWRASLLGSSSR